MKLHENHIIIGVGGTGGNILKSIRKRLFTEVPSADDRRNLNLGFVYIDSSQENMKPNDPTWKVLGQNSQLGKDSFLFIRGASLGSQLENVDNFPGIKSWIGNRKIWDNLVGSVGDDGAAAQRRRLGRFLFSCAVADYEAVLKNQVKMVREKSQKTDVTFHIVTGLAGGTGSGSIVDVIAQTRKHYQSNIGSGLKHKILVYCLVPEQSPLPGWDKGFYHANGFAALQEINALQVKRFIPHDVSGEYEYVPLDNVDKVFNSCFLFTNANENGITVNTQKDLPEIVSDLLFHYMTLSVDETTRMFEDAFTLENIADGEKENDEKAKTFEIANQTKPVRTRRFNAFGIKRIVSPEEEIVEYFTYNFAKQSMLQFKYNNWSDDIGYRDQPKNEDYITFVNDKGTLNNWMLTDAHLTLSLPILPSEKDQKWKTFQDYWNGVIPSLGEAAWNDAEARKSQSLALNFFAGYCEERFTKNFRKVGVPEFFKVKIQARKDLAKEICDTIQKDIFGQWQTGQKSIHEICRLMETLIQQTEMRLQKYDSKLTSLRDAMEKIYFEKDKNEKTFSSTGVIAQALLASRKRVLQNHITVLQDLYIKKTELEGTAFAQKLLAEVLNEMQLLNNDIKKFYETIDTSINAAEKEIATRCREERLSGDSFKKGVVVKFYDPEEVENFNKRVTRDPRIQSAQTAKTRNEIAALARSEKTFTALNENATEDILMDIFSANARESAIQAHNELITNKKEKLIGINIVEKLKEEYGSSEKQTELDQFARNMMESSGVFLTFDKSEISKQLKNNDPPRPGIIVMTTSTLISIPKSPENQDFVNKLVETFKRNSDGSKKIIVDTNSERMNEITIINISSCFSLRMVNDLKILKQKYDLMVGDKAPNPDVARLVLHLEGDGTQYPAVFPPPPPKPGELILKSMPYLLLANTLKIIDFVDRMDGTGKKAFCISKVDDLGIPTAVMLGEKFIDILNSPPENEEDVCEEIITDVQAKLAGDYLHITKRAELEEEVKKLLSGVILPECKNITGDPTFLKFREATTEAIKILKS